MNTKEAIEFLKYDIKLFPHKAETLPACLEIYKCVERIEEVIKCLQRGEKHEAMWGELDTFIMEANHPYSMANEMKKLKQKYFPKPERYKRINDILDQLTPPGAVIDIKELKNLLIELRDEE